METGICPFHYFHLWAVQAHSGLQMEVSPALNLPCRPSKLLLDMSPGGDGVLDRKDYLQASCQLL